MKDETKSLGYDQEEEYFYKLNKDLIEKQRRALDRDRHKQKAGAQAEDWWMVCPKCGQDMQETDVLGIKVERCVTCKGTFFDKGEIDLLIDSREHQRFMSYFKGLLE